MKGTIWIQKKKLTRQNICVQLCSKQNQIKHAFTLFGFKAA